MARAYLDNVMLLKYIKEVIQIPEMVHYMP